MSASVDYRKSNLKALRADVDETTQVLKVTVDKLVDRGERLDALTAKADDLNTSSVHFHGSARRVHQRMKWQNYKITICLSKFHFILLKRRKISLCSFFVIVVVAIVVITVIVIVIVKPWKKK